VQQGFVILAKNWTMRGGELDGVARRGSLVVICEVKARANNDFGSALEAITDEKIRRVRRTGFHFVRSLEESGLKVRFDVATVTGVHLEMFHDAF
jgi:putative endonuclease